MRKRKWPAEKRSMEQTFALITGRKTKIIDIKPSENELGYTSANGEIHIAEDHPIMKDLDENNKMAFRNGVFCHEMLHQIFTDFEALEKELPHFPKNERRIFAKISNILEDPAIEYFAPTVVSGPLLESLRFTIAHVYKTSKKLEEAKSAMAQYVNALIQFGDMGLLKGHFTFPEAEKCFAETAELFDKGITEPKAKKRIDYAKEIFEISRPLWQSEADIEKLLQELADLFSQLGKSPMSGSGHGMDADASDMPETKKDKRRKITIKKVTKEELEKLKNNGEVSSGPIPEDEDVTILVCDEDLGDDGGQGDGASLSQPEDNKKGNSEEMPNKKASGAETKDDVSDPSETGNGSVDKKDEESDENESSDSSKGDSPDNVEESSENVAPEKSESVSNQNESNDADKDLDKISSNSPGADSEEEKSENGEQDNSSDTSEKHSNGNPKNNPFRCPTESGSVPSVSSSADNFDDESDSDKIDEEEYALKQEDMDAIAAGIEKAEKDLKKEAEEAEDKSVIPNYDISSPKMPKKSCLNYRVAFSEHQRATLEKTYAEVVNGMKIGIHTATKALKRIFEDDKEEREYRNSGNISLKRLYCGSITSQVFERKISPADKQDLAIMLLVDESGSMCHNGKCAAAQKSCIALAEIFNNLKIPVYVMGFTADTEGYDIVHLHYITWKNTQNDRLKLLNIAARADNCDGASIRYATEVLRKKQAKNKLLIVLSDGMPAAFNYPNGAADTKDAIRAAKKHASVLGVAIGNNDTEAIHYLYEKDFLHISNVDDLFSGIAKKLQKIIKTW